MRRNYCSLRTIQVTTYEEILQTIKSCNYAFENGAINVESKNQFVQKIWKNAVVLASYKNNDLAGYVAFYCNDHISANAYITLIAVKPEFQKNGYGKTLLEECFKRCKECGMKQIRLEVKKENSNAIKFYINNQFVYEKECSEDSIYMCRTL